MENESKQKKIFPQKLLNKKNEFFLIKIDQQQNVMKN